MRAEVQFFPAHQDNYERRKFNNFRNGDFTLEIIDLVNDINKKKTKKIKIIELDDDKKLNKKILKVLY